MLFRPLLIEPAAPNFKNQATTTSTNVTFVKVEGDTNQLIYEVQSRDTTGGIQKGECFPDNGICEVFSLIPGKKYLLSVRACISERPTICGTFSTEIASYTIPRSKC